MTEITIDPRLNGPPGSANGGCLCGAVAAHLDGPVEVTIRKPVPLGVALPLQPGEEGLTLGDGLATARAVDAPAVVPPVRPTAAEARTASEGSRFADPERNPFPTCFVCGHREDGLNLWVGAVDGAHGLRAAPLHEPAGGFTPQLLWGALDCAGYPGTTAMCLLGRMTAELPRPVASGEAVVAVGWDLGTEGRKHHTASALLDAQGAIVARARSLWIALRDGALPAPAT